MYPSEPDEEDRDEIEVGSSEDDDDDDDDEGDDEQPTTSGLTSSDGSGNTIAVSCSSSETSPRSMYQIIHIEKKIAHLIFVYGYV